MKKVLVLLLIQILFYGTACYGAVSDDIYVRKDVFEVYMRNLGDKLDMILEGQKALRQDINVLSERVSVLDRRVDRLEARMNGLDKRIDGLDKRIDGVDKRVESVDKRIDDLRNGIYLWLVAIGLFLSWPKAQKMLQSFGKSTPSITLEDVRRLIEENNMKLSGKAQV
ncbi:MAG: hypothetical protein IJG30_00385 [Synergistaceae bacterium]|nr:hypothetical protein [Synergistaceae bacterium]